jgi:hypothetical protein
VQQSAISAGGNLAFRLGRRTRGAISHDRDEGVQLEPRLNSIETSPYEIDRRHGTGSHLRRDLFD